MDDEQTGYMGVTRWVSFSHHGEPESGEARTMDDRSVWARIAGPDPKGDDDRWVMLLDPAGVEAAGVDDVRFSDVTMSVTAGDALPLPDCEGEVRQDRLHPGHVRERRIRPGGGRGEAVRPSLRQGSYGNGFRGLKTGFVISVFRYLPVPVSRYPVG